MLKLNDMNNSEKAKEIAWNDSLYNDNQSCAEQCFIAALQMAQWKDEKTKQLLIEKTKLLSPSAAQNSVKRCTIEEIYRELFNEEMTNSNPYIK